MVQRESYDMGVQTAMIIDDDEDLGKLLAVALEQRKIYAMAVQSLPEAKDFLEYMKPTFIFLDNSFPEGLGINFIDEIRSADHEIYIIMMTADTDSWIEEKAKEQGAYFMSKPFCATRMDGILAEIHDLKTADKYYQRHG